MAKQSIKALSKHGNIQEIEGQIIVQMTMEHKDVNRTTKVYVYVVFTAKCTLISELYFHCVRMQVTNGMLLTLESGSTFM